MKKVLSVLLAVFMLAGICMMSVSAAFTIGGATGSDTLPSTSIPADVMIKVSGDTVHKYAVDIDFGALVFAYGAKQTWNPVDHVYTTSDNATWSGDGDITITNHSDMAIAYSGEFTDVQTYGTAAPKFAGNVDAVSGTLAAVLHGAAAGNSETVEVVMTGVPQNVFGTATKIANVVITVEAVTTTTP